MVGSYGTAPYPRPAIRARLLRRLLAARRGSRRSGGPFWDGRADDELRHAEAEFHPLPQRNCLDGSVVHVGDPAHDREAEARAGQGPRLRRPVETIEDV